MYELHEKEQYLFEEETLEHLTIFLREWSAPCCICAPLLGRYAVERGIPVAILDIDERFADVRGFRYYDLYKPEWMDQEFDLILCDPRSLTSPCHSCLLLFVCSVTITGNSL